MNTKEFAEARGITLKEAKEITGNTHWNQEVADVVGDATEIIEDTVELVEDVVEEVATFIDDNPELLREAIALQTGIGYKTPAYLAFVLKHKDELKAEYEKVKGLIERYIEKLG